MGLDEIIDVPWSHICCNVSIVLRLYWETSIFIIMSINEYS